MNSNKQKSALAPELGFGEAEYAEVWRSLQQAVGEGDFFGGVVTTCHVAGFISHLTTTLIIYRDRHSPEHPIVDIAPVWWEMATCCPDDDGVECPNDFSFCEFRDVIRRLLGGDAEVRFNDNRLPSAVTVATAPEKLNSLRKEGK